MAFSVMPHSRNAGMQGFGWRGVPEAEDRPAGFLKLLRTIAEHPSRPAVMGLAVFAQNPSLIEHINPA